MQLNITAITNICMSELAAIRQFRDCKTLLTMVLCLVHARTVLVSQLNVITSPFRIRVVLMKLKLKQSNYYIKDPHECPNMTFH